jgi:competence ComEA-like helix-hairpin-helix protein
MYNPQIHTKCIGQYQMSEPINLNEANARTLTRLPGIGRATAHRIVAYRNEHGPFTDLNDLLPIRGVSKNLLAQIANDVILTSAPPAQPNAPQTVAPQTVAPQTVAPQTVAPQTVAPRPQTESPMSEPNNTPATPEEVVVEPQTISNTRRPTLPNTPPPASANDRASQQAYEQRAVRRGCLTIILGATLGALLGMSLTLAVLNSLNNNSLQYSNSAIQLRSQLDDEINARQEAVDALATDMSTMATAQSGLEATRSKTLAEMNSLVSTSAAGQAALAQTAVALETRIASAANAADTLDSFLLGLDTLLNEVGPTPDATATPTPRATATAVRSTPTTGPTRTPNPTATPLFPTATP